MLGEIINTEDSALDSVIINEEDFLSSFSIHYGLMEVPSVDLVLPVTFAKYLTGHSRIVLFDYDWRYEGNVDSKDIDFDKGIVRIKTSHIVGGLSKRTLPTNVTIKQKTITETMNHVLSWWEVDDGDIINKIKFRLYGYKVNEDVIEYEFSNETFLEYMTKLCEHTTDVYWRVSRHDPYLVEFSEFGEQQNILIDENNYMISIDAVEEDYTQIVNASVVMSDKSDGGTSTLTLRDIYYNPQYIDPLFPVIKTPREVNSQRSYKYPQLLVFAPDGSDEEFAVIDAEGLALEAGELYWGTITQNDIQAIADNNEEITDEDRLNATLELYKVAKRKLKNSRRKIDYRLKIKPFPKKSVEVGDKVMLVLNYGVHELTPCSKYYQKVLNEHDWFYVKEIDDEYGEGWSYQQSITLSKYIHSSKDTIAN